MAAQRPVRPAARDNPALRTPPRNREPGGAHHMSHAREISTLRQAIAIVSRHEGGWHGTIADLDALATRLEGSDRDQRPLVHVYGKLVRIRPAVAGLGSEWG